ncbi:cobalt-precorrin 5A hydrolase [Shimia isoporae]|uniref:Cobalt-precorrin 5A hydrolase n=1 Tax=Shimia isoporae TaxID=647720 RepID=A0A4R1NP16_9RHOB|nr:cobalamin biosynthesis protein [Shimia isoporae]TCL10197.1 cobalt-precorrin 5A hydrolase [Shimia isoporae]
MIVAGFGFRAAATTESLRDALAITGEVDVAALATASDKAQSTAIQKLAAELSVPVIEIPAEIMASVKTTTQSAKVIEKRGTGSVAEACALIAAGTGAELKKERVVSGDRLATCAIAYGALK